MGFFTKSQIDEIRKKILDRHSIKDSEFVTASELTGEEEVAILQDGENKRTSLDEIKYADCTLNVYPRTGTSVTPTILINGVEQSTITVASGTMIQLEVSAPGYATYCSVFPLVKGGNLYFTLLPQEAESDYLAVRWDNGALPASGGDYSLYYDSNQEADLEVVDE